MARTAAEDSGVTAPRLERIPFGTGPAEVAAIVGRDGGVILTHALTPDQVRAINGELDLIIGPMPTGTFGEGEDNDIAVNYGLSTKRLQHCVKHSKTFREAFLGNETLAQYVSAVLPGKTGSHSLFAAQAIEIHPGETEQKLHRDSGAFLEAMGLNHAEGINLVSNFLLALTDITEEMGATRVIPGSHKWDDFSVEGSQAQTIPATMQAGDALFFNGKLLHGGGANTTKNRSRRVISTAFSLSFLTSEEAWPFVISVDEAREYPRLVQGYIGFRSVVWRGESPGFLWRAHSRPLEDYLGL